ncbi:unnamed protein product [Effrenium voratum]|nr:unnamed protein product [Effrenium voratum]
MLRAVLLTPLLAYGEELHGSCRAQQLRQVARLETEEWEGHIDGLECHRLSSRRCCPEGPARQVLAWLQLAADHNRQQLSSLETAVSNAIALREMLDDDCRNIQEALLLARAGALKAMVEDAQSILEMVVHLVISGLCRFCFDISEENLVELRDKEAAAKLAEALAKFQRLQVDLERRSLTLFVAGEVGPSLW